MSERTCFSISPKAAIGSDKLFLGCVSATFGRSSSMSLRGILITREGRAFTTGLTDTVVSAATALEG